jgi:hypothetical protein
MEQKVYSHRFIQDELVNQFTCHKYKKERVYSMKRFMKKAAAVLMAAVVMAGVYTPVASAESNKVIIHAKDGGSWGSVNVYNWGDAGETAGVWPGTAMTAEEDGWYTYTIETEVNLNLVFSAAGGAPQSSNIDGVAMDAGEIWVVIGGEGEANDLGAATAQAVLYTEAEEGWPSTAAEETVAAAETADTEIPKTGENAPILAVVLLGLAALSANMVVVMKKKERTNEN